MSVPMRWEYAVVAEPLVSPSPRKSHPPKRRRKLWRSLFVGIGCLTAVGFASAGTVHWLQEGRIPALRLQPSSFTASSVSLASASAKRSLGFVTVAGSVANRTTRPYDKVEAIVELLDAHNRTVALESALIAFDPLPASASAPFQVEMEDSSQAVGYRVRFRQLYGPALN